jgi:hypothetical protein
MRSRSAAVQPGTELVAGRPWERITQVCAGAGRRMAAVAYIGKSAPKLMPLRRGDVLVANAGASALLAHATNPWALEDYLNAGVDVFMCESLHAKVVVTPRAAVIGSANASENSTRLDEAVLVTNDAAIIKAARAFVGSLDRTPVDAAFLRLAKDQWDRGRGGGPPGTDGTPAQFPFLPDPVARIVLVAFDTADMTKSEWAAWIRDRRRAVRQVTGTGRYAHTPFVIPKNDGIRRGDVIMFTGDDGTGELVYPPDVIVFDPSKLRGSAMLECVCRSRKDLSPKHLPDVRQMLAAMGHRLRVPAKSAVIRDPKRVGAFLNLWGLKPGDV